MRPTVPKGRPHHPAVLEHHAERAASIQLRLADAIIAFAGSMQFVSLTLAALPAATRRHAELKNPPVRHAA